MCKSFTNVKRILYPKNDGKNIGYIGVCSILSALTK